MPRSFRNASSSTWYEVMFATYCIVAVVMNIFAMKTLGTGNVAICDGGLTISWIIFLISSIVTEVWGKEKARKMFTITTCLSFVFMLLGRLIVEVPVPVGAEYSIQEEAFRRIFSNGPRTILASVIAFYIGNLINVEVIDKLRAKFNKHTAGHIIFRAIFATLVGQLVDNAMFTILAMGPFGISVYEVPWAGIVSLVLVGTLIELAVEALVVPFISVPTIRFLTQKCSEENSVA